MFTPGQPTGAPPVTIEIPGRTGMQLVELAQRVGAKTPGHVVAQALSLLQLVLDAKAQGQRVLMRDPATGREIDVSL